MSIPKQPSLSKFRASRKSMTWAQCAELLKIDEKYTDAPRAIVYMNSVYIEDYVFRGYKHNFEHYGRYVLVIDRQVHYSHSLRTLERLLYHHMIDQEGGF